VKIFVVFNGSETKFIRMRIAATPSLAPVRAMALVPRARAGHGRDGEANLPVPAHLVVTPVHASAAFLAQSIAQEIMGGDLPREASLADAYLPKATASFEGLNFRTLA